jgi:hypothetical protein
MPTLSISTSYADGDPLYKADLDDLKNGIETFLNSTKIDSDNIQAGGISTTALAASCVTAAKLGSSAVETAKINDNAVTGAKLNSNVVDNSTLQYATSQLSIKALGVGTAQLAAAAVTQAKRASPVTVTSSSSTSAGTPFSTTNTSYEDVTNLGVNYTSSGQVAVAFLVPDGAGAAAIYNSNTSAVTYVALAQDGVVIAEWKVTTNGFNPTSFCFPVIGLTAGVQYAFRIKAKVSANTGTVDNYRLVVCEL